YPVRYASGRLLADAQFHSGGTEMFRLFTIRWFLRLFIPLVLGVLLLALATRVYHFLRGRRNRDQGIPCIRGKRWAFPVAGSPKRYRCRSCDLRFKGAEHD